MEKRFIGDNNPVDESEFHNRGSYIVGVDADDIVRFSGRIQKTNREEESVSSYAYDMETVRVTYILDNGCEIEYDCKKGDYRPIKGCPEDLYYCIFDGWKLREICHTLLKEKDTTATTIESIRRKYNDLRNKKAHLQKEFNILNERYILMNKNKNLEDDIEELEKCIAENKFLRETEGV